MKRCYGYVRVSTVKQGEGVSLDAQKEAISDFARRNGFDIIEWFKETETAAKRGRPRFNAMLAALRRGKADAVIFHKIDRSARNFTDWGKVGDLIDAGIDVRFAHEDMDMRSRGGRLTADIQAVIAADYIRNLKDEIRKGINGRLKQGLYPWPAPIGYLNNGGGKPKTLDPKTAQLIREAFELYATGEHSFNSLLLEMRKRGLSGRQNVKLSMRGLETIINNPFYCGIIRIRSTGETFDGVHEPIIPVSLFEHVQQLKSDKCGKKVTRHNHIFQGLFRCGLCTGPMVPELQKGHVYYRCKRRECVTTSVREEIIEEQIRKLFEQIRLEENAIHRTMEQVDAWVNQRASGFVDPKNSILLAEAESKMERLTDALIDRLIDQETYSKRKTKIQFEITKLKQERAKASDLRQKAVKIREVAELAKSLGNAYDLANRTQKRQLVKIGSSNRHVIEKDVYLAPSNWVKRIEDMVLTFGGEPHGGDGRTAETDKLSNDFTKILLDVESLNTNT
ncbi:recombinase family protein [Sphingorhabdus sp. Alg231-15]|uniref:recombinase family protein n=1 Tax=Sphingorhabdus sp. Alg231-15 TaxID=1922222 RepID=UPI000D555BED